jgi:RNA polymerase sigma factor (TIGR02999 family)
MSDAAPIPQTAGGGERQAAAQLLPLVYDELRRLAAFRLAHEAPGQTLDTTALVHEAYLRLVAAGDPPRWCGRGHFVATAAEAMRRILVENARRKKRLCHGGGRRRVNLDGADQAARDPQDWLALDDALTKLAAEDAPAAEVAKLRLFAGQSVEEAAEAMGLARATAYRHWSYARAWLRCALTEGEGD